MKVILRQAALLTLFFAGVHCLVYALSFSVIPQERYVDVWAGSSVWCNEYFYVLCTDSVRLQRSSKPKLIILGSSNSGLGFRPQHLQPLFPDYEVANLSLPGSDIADMRQVLEITLKLLSPEVRQRSIFVVGMWYNSVYRGYSRPGGDVNKKLIESGFFKEQDASVSPIARPYILDILIQVLRPYISAQRIFQRYSRIIGDHIKSFVEAHNKIPPRAVPIAYGLGMPYSDPLTEEQKQWEIRRFSNECNLKSDGGFIELRKMCRLVNAYGGNLVLVDLPLADWHRQTAAFEKYQEQKQPYFEEFLQFPHVQYIDFLSDPVLSDDKNLRDGVHPRLESTELWSRALKEKCDLNMSGETFVKLK